MLVIASLSAGKKSVKIKISLFEKITKFFLAFSLSLCYSTSDIISNFCLETDRPLRTWCRGQVLFVWNQFVFIIRGQQKKQDKVRPAGSDSITASIDPFCILFPIPWIPWVSC